MDGSIRLSAQERKVLLQEVRRGSDSERRLRAHVVLLLGEGLSWSVIVAVLFTSTSTVNRWRKRYLAGGVPAVLESARPRCRRWQWWISVVDQRGDSLDHPAIASGLRLLPQSLDLWHGGGVARRGLRRAYEPGDSPTQAA